MLGLEATQGIQPSNRRNNPKKKRKARKGQEKDDTDKKHGKNDNGEKKHDKNGSADDKKKGGTKGGAVGDATRADAERALDELVAALTTAELAARESTLERLAKPRKYWGGRSSGSTSGCTCSNDYRNAAGWRRGGAADSATTAMWMDMWMDGLHSADKLK